METAASVGRRKWHSFRLLALIWLASVAGQSELGATGGCEWLLQDSTPDEPAARDCLCKEAPEEAIRSEVPASATPLAPEQNTSQTGSIGQLLCRSSNLAELELSLLARALSNAAPPVNFMSVQADSVIEHQHRLDVATKTAPQSSLQVNHLDLQLGLISHSNKADEVTAFIERQLMDLCRILSESHLQFLSISVQLDCQNCNKDIQLNLKQLLSGLSELSRLEFSLISKQDKQTQHHQLQKTTILIIESDTFRSLSKLKWLNLNSGIKFELNGDSSTSPFLHTRYLEYLNLNGNKLKSFPLLSLFTVSFKHKHENFFGLPNLSSINLANNQISSLTNELFTSSGNETFSHDIIKSNQFKHLQKCLQNSIGQNFLLPEMNLLDLSRNKISGLTFNEAQFILCSMPNLSQLYLQHNKIYHINLNSLLIFPFNKQPKSILLEPQIDYRKDYQISSKEIHSRLEFIDLSYNNLRFITAIITDQDQNETLSSSNRINALIKSINFAHNQITRPIQIIESNLIDTILFEESFSFLGSRANNLINGEITEHLNVDANLISLDTIVQSFKSSNNHLNVTLCDLLTTKSTTISNEDLISEVILNENQIESIKSTYFNSQRCNNIQILQLAKNKVINIDSDSFLNLINLQILDLSYNFLTSLQNITLFSKNSKLKQLNLSKNKIRLLDRRIFSHLTELEDLRLDTNELVELSTDLFKSNLHLNYLDLSKNKLFYLDELTFSNLKQLRILNLNENQLKEFNERLFDKQIKPFASLVSNEKMFTVDYQKSTKLKTNNSIKENNKSIRKKQQSNRNSKLTKHSKRQTFENSDETILVLASNNLDTFEFNICSDFIGYIKYLWLNNNLLKSISSNSFKCTPKLQRLYMQSNRIRSLDVNAFANLKQIEFIDLSQNMIKFIAQGTFADLNSLNHLGLSENSLNRLKISEAFGLQQDQFNVIANDEKRNKIQLESIDVHGNKDLIIDIGDLIFTVGSTLRVLDLTGTNQITLDTKLLKTKQEYITSFESFNLSSLKNIDSGILFQLLNETSIEKLDCSSMGNFHLSDNTFEKIKLFILHKLGKNLIELKLTNNHISMSQLSQIFASDETKLVTLDISSNLIDGWPPKMNLTKLFPNLVHLNLSKNKLYHLFRIDNQTDSSLYQLTNLKRLNVSSNSLINIIEQSHLFKLVKLKDLVPNLEYLDVSNNRLSWIGGGLFEDLDRFKWLKIDHNRLESFQVFTTPSILTIDLRNNERLVSIVGDNILSNTQAENSEMPEETLEYYGDLILNGDSKSLLAEPTCLTIDEFITSLQKNSLQKIKLKDSHLIEELAASEFDIQSTELTNERCQEFLQQIQFLNFDSTSSQLNVNSLPLNRKLISASIRQVGLNHLNTNKNSSNIIKLDLSQNRIQELPETFCEDLAKLMDLNLNGNKLKEFPLNIFKCRHLIYLDMSFNGISTATSTTINQNLDISSSSISILKLNQNFISNLENLHLMKLKHLKYLDLRFNQLKYTHLIPNLIQKVLPIVVLVDHLETSHLKQQDNYNLNIELNSNALYVDNANNKNYSMSIQALNRNNEQNKSETLYPTNSRQTIKFCSLLNKSNLSKICFHFDDLITLDTFQTKCLYLKLKPKIASCLTSLHDPTLESSQMKQATSLDASHLLGRDENITDKSIQLDVMKHPFSFPTQPGNGSDDNFAEDDPVLGFIDSLKITWLSFKEFNLSDYIESFITKNQTFWMKLEDIYHIPTTVIIKFAIVGGSICIVSLLIAIFALLTYLNGQGSQLSSPTSTSELTDLTNTDTDTCISSSITDKSQNSGSSSKTHSKSTTNNSDENVQTVIESRKTILQLNANELASNINECLYHHKDHLQRDQHPNQSLQQNQQQQACSTPNSSLAPSSVETGETMQAVDSIRSGTSTLVNFNLNTSQFLEQPGQTSEGHYASNCDIEYTDHRRVHQQQQRPLATVMRMVKSSSANFQPANQFNDSNTTSLHRYNVGRYGTNANYSSLMRNIRQRQGPSPPASYVIQPSKSTGTGTDLRASHRCLAAPLNPPDTTRDTNLDEARFDQQDATTMSLISINTALSSNNFQSSLSQLNSPQNPTGIDEDSSSLCQYHRLFRDPASNSANYAMAPGVILEQDEEQPTTATEDSNLMSFIGFPSPPPQIRINEMMTTDPNEPYDVN